MAKKKEIKFKCHYCNNQIVVNDENVSKVVRYGDFHYHKNCFVKQCKKNINNPRCKKEIWGNTLNELDSIYSNSEKYYIGKLHKEKKKKISLSEKEISCRDNLSDFLKESYGVSVISSVFWQKMTKIVNGEDKNKPQISFEHFYDMWKRKMNFLNKTYERRITLGKEMDKESRLLYDMAILINKYDSYLSYINKQKLIEIEIEEKKAYEHLNIKYVEEEKDTKEEDDFAALVDDIFS